MVETGCVIWREGGWGVDVWCRYVDTYGAGVDGEVYDVDSLVVELIIYTYASVA